MEALMKSFLNMARWVVIEIDEFLIVVTADALLKKFHGEGIALYSWDICNNFFPS